MKVSKLTFGILAVVLIVISGFWWVGVHDPAPLAGQVATKLRNADATLYIVSDDAASQKQVSLFGSFANQVVTVDCKVQTAICDKLQLDEMPTIVIGKANVEIAGQQTLEEIKTLLQKLGLW